jgi:hypothetical protein
LSGHAQDHFLRYWEAFLHYSNTHVNNGIMRKVRNFSSSDAPKACKKQQNRTTCHASHRGSLQSPGQHSAPPHQPASWHTSHTSQLCAYHARKQRPEMSHGSPIAASAHAVREQRARWLPAVSAAPGRCRERSWPTWMLCSTFTRIGSKLKFEPILLPNGLDTACQSRTGRQVGARTCCERLVCSSQDGGRLLTSCRRSSSST